MARAPAASTSSRVVVLRLLAFSDIHVGFEVNRRALDSLADHHEDWLVLGGDLGETLEHVETVLRATVPRFARVVWVPGNHELWTMSRDPGELRGVAKYEALSRSAGRAGS